VTRVPFIEPILRYLVKHPDAVPARDVHEAAADTLGLSDARINGIGR